MPKVLSQPVGLYFEDLEIGDSAVTMSRTITETDIINFIGISGVFEELHMSLEYIKEHSIFGKRISPGPLTFIIAEGLVVQLGLIHRTAMALLGIDHMTWKAPVYCNDTIHVELEVSAKKETSKPDRGVVTVRTRTKNRGGDLVQIATMKLLVPRKPAALA